MVTVPEAGRRNHVHGLWAYVAPRWAEHADYVDDRGAELTARLLELLCPVPGDRVLELACGPGGAGLAAALIVGDHGQVVVSDVVADMVAIAGSRARARGLRNVTPAVLDLEAIDRPDASFDRVVCREGLMFAVDPRRALEEIHRVLRPGGRLAVSVWGPKEANPWLGVVIDAVAAVTGMTIPPPGMPGPFSLADGEALAALVADAGFGDVSHETVAVPLRSPSFEAWWTRTAAVAGPAAAILDRLDAARRAEIEDLLRAAVAPYSTGAGIDFPGLAHIVSGVGLVEAGQARHGALEAVRRWTSSTRAGSLDR